MVLMKTTGRKRQTTNYMEGVFFLALVNSPTYVSKILLHPYPNTVKPRRCEHLNRPGSVHWGDGFQENNT